MGREKSLHRKVDPGLDLAQLTGGGQKETKVLRKHRVSSLSYLSLDT